MPRLRANPNLIGGQIRLRSSRRVADFKWLGVIAVMLGATAIEGLPLAQFGRAAVAIIAGDRTVAVAARAEADVAGEAPVRLVSDAGKTGRGAFAAAHMSDFATADGASRATTGRFGRPMIEVRYCPRLGPGSDS